MVSVSLSGRTFVQLAAALTRGETTARALTEGALETIAADTTAFTRVDADAARLAADAADRSRAQGTEASPFAGIPVSVKALFDCAGEITTAGAALRADAAPASADAPVVARLKAVGLVIIGVTQMSEFAFTGLGLNPHFAELANPLDRERVPGGSSGGAAASVALGQVAGAIGTDTGGSVRIPAAFCGLTGFKPTQRRVSRAGAFPLSPTLDSIGPIAHSAGCCAILDDIISDGPRKPEAERSVTRTTFGVPEGLWLEDLDPPVAQAFEAALGRLSAAGAWIARFPLPDLGLIAQMNAGGSISAVECHELHNRLGYLDQRQRYDPNVLARIDSGARLSQAGYRALLAARERLIAEVRHRTRGIDILLAPTCALLAPKLTEIANPADFARVNQRALRNASVVNMLDRCAISLPIATEAPVPAGLMLVGETMADSELLSLAMQVETVLA